jgi:ubiquitin-conjugating enzyme E2 variant
MNNENAPSPIAFHTIVEYVSIVTFPVLLAVFFYLSITLLAQAGLMWLLLPLILIGWLAGDWVSGLVHWFCDTYGSEETPFFGQAIILPFREHHVLPGKICEHNFVETNGNSFLLGVVVVIPFLFAMLASEPGDTFVPVAGTLMVFTGIFSCLANQVHKWSHADAASVPAVVRLLQRHHLILNPDHHQLHHTSPFDTNYCISCGWMNPVLEMTRFFRRAERLLGLFGLQPARSENAPAPVRSPT